MSRRHSSSRRRNYGRRQHEIRERRPTDIARADWPGLDATGGWHLIEQDEEHPSARAGDGFGANTP
ncbi:MAG: hypothetical protein WD830_10860 [Chloroflexota bacterium]